jgi:hypothetical protein
MTTYPLSEPATIYRTAEPNQTDDRATARVEVNDMDLRYGPGEIEELLTFLREEGHD